VTWARRVSLLPGDDAGAHAPGLEPDPDRQVAAFAPAPGAAGVDTRCVRRSSGSWERRQRAGTSADTRNNDAGPQVGGSSLDDRRGSISTRLPDQGRSGELPLGRRGFSPQAFTGCESPPGPLVHRSYTPSLTPGRCLRRHYDYEKQEFGPNLDDAVSQSGPRQLFGLPKGAQDTRIRTCDPLVPN
jgi:hypothetical protein